MITKYTALALGAALSLAASAKTYTIGEWTVDDRGFALSHGSQRLVERLGIGYWSQNYAKDIFKGRWQASETAGGVTFTRECAAVKAVLSFSGEGAKLRQTLAFDFRQTPGPVEYGFEMDPARFAVGAKRAVMRVGGQYVEITDDPFPVTGTRRFAWETVAASYTFENATHGAGFYFQDRRKNGVGIIRYIHQETVEEPKSLRFENVWEARTYAGEAALAARKALLSRSLRQSVPVAVTNPGFEDGKTDWDMPANAKVVSDVAHSGAKSARIDVREPGPGTVYVSRLIPVEEGGQYKAAVWLKTLGVEEAPTAKIGQVGATLIVEWADAKRRWFQGGGYARGVWGTNDWTRLTIARITAPPRAAYAWVYLALRARGTTWFDDLSFEKLSFPVCKDAPATGAALNSNTPRFTWRTVPGWRRYDLVLSQKADFPKAETRRYDAGGQPTYQLAEPLAPGTWYWKVETKGMSDTLPSSFTVSVPLSADTLPSEVLTPATRVTAADVAFTATVRERTAETPKVMAKLGACAVQGVCTARTEDGLLTYRFAAPQGGWPAGYVEGTLEATDGAGNTHARAFYFLNAPKPANAVFVDAGGEMRENGRRIFPFGIYEVGPEDLAEVRAAGFDAVHQYKWEGNHDDALCRRYLDQCWAANGLRAFIGFDRGPGTGEGIVQGNFAAIAHRVGTLADHPGLFCWYLFDEPELMNQFVAPELLIAFADLVRALDPYHPVVMTTWNATMIEYRRSWDTHWTQAYGNPAQTLSRLEEERGYLKGESPLTLLIYSGDMKQTALRRKGIKPDPAKFFPDTDALRACAFLGITRNCNGLWMWWFARHASDYYTVAHSPQGWASVKKVLGEMAALRPVLAAEGVSESGIVTAGKAKVSWWTKRVGDKTTFLAVNTSEKPVTVTIDVPRFGKRTLTFARYEVKNETL